MNRSLWAMTIAGALLATGVPSVAQAPATAFQAGDRILLHVEVDSALSDTFTVVAGPALRLPNIGEISLAATLDQLGIQAGDRIQVPGQRDPDSKWRIVGIVVTPLAPVVTVAALTLHH